MNEPGGGFLSRWARRKEQARAGAALASEPIAELPAAPVAVTPAALSASAVAAPPEAHAEPAVAEPPPTLADVALLTRDSDYARFVAGGVDESVKRAAMKKLFADPHFNVMDGLDTYIADYGQPDPIPLAMLRQMNQSVFLKLFDDEDDDPKTPTPGADAALAAAAPAAAPLPSAPDDDDADLRLQQDDAAGRPGPDQGPRA